MLLVHERCRLFSWLQTRPDTPTTITQPPVVPMNTQEFTKKFPLIRHGPVTVGNVSVVVAQMSPQRNPKLLCRGCEH